MLKKFLDKNGEAWWQQPWMLGFRDITRPTDQRTLICSVLPAAFGAGNSLNLLFPGKPEFETACLLANLNSLVLDFVERIKQSGAHASRFLIYQLPVLSPNHYSEKARKYIVSRVAKLTRNSREIRDVWLTDFPDYKFQDPRERLEIRARARRLHCPSLQIEQRRPCLYFRSSGRNGGRFSFAHFSFSQKGGD